MDILDNLYSQREMLIKQLAWVEVRIAQNCEPVLDGIVDAEMAAELNLELVLEELQDAIQLGFEVL